MTARFICDHNYLPCAVEIDGRAYTLAELSSLRVSLALAEELIAVLHADAERRGDTVVLEAIEGYYVAVMEALPPLSEEDKTRAERITRAVLEKIGAAR